MEKIHFPYTVPSAVAVRDCTAAGVSADIRLSANSLFADCAAEGIMASEKVGGGEGLSPTISRIAVELARPSCPSPKPEAIMVSSRSP